MKWKLWLNIATFLALGVVIVLAWHDIVAAFLKMETLNGWVLLLAAAIQVGSFVSVAKVYYYSFRAMGQTVSLRTLIPATFELNFVNHIFPSGGISGFSYLNLRLRHEDVSSARSTLAQISRFVFAFITFIAWLMLALISLAATNQASGLIILIATALTVSIVFVMLVIVYVIGSPTRIKIFARFFTQSVNRLISLVRPSSPRLLNLEKAESTFNELHEDYKLIRSSPRDMKLALLWAFIANGAEFGVLYAVFIAHGAWVNLGAVIMAYAVATTAGLIAILPGGLGLYEPLMAAILLSAGVPAALAVSVTLVYRVISLLLALGSGYVLYHITLNRDAGHHTER